MRALADECGVSQPFISAMERGQSMPSIDTLYRLATVLDVEPASLLPVSANGDITVVRAGEGEVVASTDRPESAVGRLLLSDPARRLEIFEYSIRPDDDLDVWYHHPGTVVLRLQAGSLDVELAGHPTVRLQPGDCLVHPGPVPHRWSLVEGAGDAHLFLVISRAGTD